MMGELIQMNARMVIKEDIAVMIAIGMIWALVFFILTALAAREKGKPRRALYVTFFAALACAGIVTAIVGANQPRVKEIRACVNGPVSLEQVAAVYDIVEVDGKELTLRVR